MRTAKEILADMVEAVREHEANRDAEWDFKDRHGECYSWNDEEEKEHDQILADISKSHDRLVELVREATGDNSIWF